jgi:hypothetical protein
VPQRLVLLGVIFGGETFLATISHKELERRYRGQSQPKVPATSKL